MTIKYDKYGQAAALVRRLGDAWICDSGGDAAIVHTPYGQVALSRFMPIDMVTVCNACHRASCWHGLFMCEDSGAGTVDLPRAVLHAIAQEHSDYNHG